MIWEIWTHPGFLTLSQLPYFRKFSVLLFQVLDVQLQPFKLSRSKPLHITLKQLKPILILSNDIFPFRILSLLQMLLHLTLKLFFSKNLKVGSLVLYNCWKFKFCLVPFWVFTIFRELGIKSENLAVFVILLINEAFLA